MKESSSLDYRERRRIPRYVVNCRCWVEQDAVTLFGTVTNLSARGIFLRTLPIVNEGSNVDVRLSIESGVVIGKGAVRWRTPPTGGGGAPGSLGAPGMGIEIVNVTTGEELLERFIARKSLVPIPEY